MICLSVISANGRDVAVLVHDVEGGRLLYRVRPSDALFQKALDLLAGRELIHHEEDPEHGFGRRRRILRDDPDYLRHFIDRAVPPPYQPGQIETHDDGSADRLVDEVYDARVGAGT